jgi:hypothetical protein
MGIDGALSSSCWNCTLAQAQGGRCSGWLPVCSPRAERKKKKKESRRSFVGCLRFELLLNCGRGCCLRSGPMYCMYSTACIIHISHFTFQPAAVYCNGTLTSPAQREQSHSYLQPLRGPVRLRRGRREFPCLCPLPLPKGHRGTGYFRYIVSEHKKEGGQRAVIYVVYCSLLLFSSLLLLASSWTVFVESKVQ